MLAILFGMFRPREEAPMWMTFSMIECTVELVLVVLILWK